MTTQSDDHHLDTARLPFIDAKRSGRAGPSGRQARNLPNARYSHHSSPRARHELKFVLGASASMRTTWPCHWAAPPAPPVSAEVDRRRACVRRPLGATGPGPLFFESSSPPARNAPKFVCVEALAMRKIQASCEVAPPAPTVLEELTPRRACDGALCAPTAHCAASTILLHQL